jgi:hypothetical protein
MGESSKTSKGDNLHGKFASFFTYWSKKLSRRNVIVSSWAVVILTLTILAYEGARPGWDSVVMWNAIQTLGHNGDPYAEGIQRQQIFHLHQISGLSEQRPFVYVYSPLTLPVIRQLKVFPFWLLATIYTGVVAFGYLLQLWAGFQMATESERRWLTLALPFLVFFPGLLNSDIVMSGNIAYPVYGLILATAVMGWKRGRWHWYYIAVVLASLFKIPFLTLLAFPILVGKRQWLPACGAAAAAALVYITQALLWPSLFRENLLTVHLDFEYERDFGLSPSGILGTKMWSLGQAHLPVVLITYLVFTTMVGIILLYLAHLVKQSVISNEVFLPLAIVGTVLLSPRIKEYDVAAITIPILLVIYRALHFAWNRNLLRRSFPSFSAMHRISKGAIIAVSGLFLILNVIAGIGSDWSPTESVILTGAFIFGSLNIGSLTCPAWMKWNQTVNCDAADSIGEPIEP